MAEATCTSLPVPDVVTVGISMPSAAHPWLLDMDWVRTLIIHQPSEPTNHPKGREGTTLDPAEELCWPSSGRGQQSHS